MRKSTKTKTTTKHNKLLTNRKHTNYTITQTRKPNPQTTAQTTQSIIQTTTVNQVIKQLQPKLKENHSSNKT